MPNGGGRLSSLKVTRAREPGMFADGDGLYLQVTHANSRSWTFRYFRNGGSCARLTPKGQTKWRRQWRL
jgi:YD repeat-containing protein